MALTQFKSEAAAKTAEAIARAAAVDEAWNQIDHHIACIAQICGDFHDDPTFGRLLPPCTAMIQAIPDEEE